MPHKRSHRSPNFSDMHHGRSYCVWMDEGPKTWTPPSFYSYAHFIWNVLHILLSDLYPPEPSQPVSCMTLSKLSKPRVGVRLFPKTAMASPPPCTPFATWLGHPTHVSSLTFDPGLALWHLWTNRTWWAWCNVTCSSCVCTLGRRVKKSRPPCRTEESHTGQLERPS